MLNYDKCATCLHSRPIVSENGFHPVCCFSARMAIGCMLGLKDLYATVERSKTDE